MITKRTVTLDEGVEISFEPVSKPRTLDPNEDVLMRICISVDEVETEVVVSPLEWEELLEMGNQTIYKDS